MSDDRPNTHFDRFNAWYEDGHVGALPATQLRVLWALEKYADNVTGETWPSPELISTKLGINVRNVQRAIACLVDRGFTTAGKSGSGRGNRGKRRMLIPPPVENPAQCATFNDRKNPAHGGKKTRRTVAGKPGAPLSENPAQCATRTTHEQSKEHTNNNTGGGGSRIFFGWMGRKTEEAAIKKHGVEHVDRLAKLINLKIQLGECSTPKLLMRHLLKLDPGDVDFRPLEDHEHAEAQAARYRERAEREEREREQYERDYEDACATFSSVPAEDRDKWRRFLLRYFPNGVNRADKDDTIAAAAIIKETPDVGAVLAAEDAKEAEELEAAKAKVRRRTAEGSTNGPRHRGTTEDLAL